MYYSLSAECFLLPSIPQAERKARPLSSGQSRQSLHYARALSSGINATWLHTADSSFISRLISVLGSRSLHLNQFA